MYRFILNKNNPEIEFQLNAEDSSLLIHSAFVTSQNNFENKWTNFISKVKLTTELKFVVFDDQQGRFIDERKNQIPIHLLVDPYCLAAAFTPISGRNTRQHRLHANR